jgi:hypothetical protein
MKTIYSTMILLLALASFGKAQEEEQERTQTFFVGAMPQYMALRALRLETEYRPENSHYAFTASPQLYYGYVDDISYVDLSQIENIQNGGDYGTAEISENNEMFGWGIETSIKYYVNDNFRTDGKVNFYLGLGLGYNRIEYSYDITPDDELFIEETTTVTRFYPELQLGGSVFIKETLVIEAYAGYGMKIPNVEGVKKLGLNGRFNDGFFTDKGTYGFLGIKVGFFLF